ncbi:class I SAM-dependent methyltransferase [Falsirhodobacter xinxiangensis]|uniref:class I SAM-dependent methyltransferase n=1 Tax=Falsirhodobacter xinxiangensis TaxID=2530049 RepID=UPI0010A9CB4F|nr:class I SAM-dependent methyltransferase [Rhodobacter xinxiangensis]
MAKREKIRLEAAPQDGNDLETVLGLRSMFRKPHYLNTSAWTEHVPFAFWMIEALRPRVFVELGSHYGVSYFAFCQAVEQHGLGTRCHAVDTWKGDEHAGFYGDEVFKTVRAHNDAHYSGFSQLIRATFDDTLEYFADGSIDLLHIDGLHTLEAVRHDFEAWLPKMSDRGVILLHDTNVRERGFGVHLLMDELRSRHPVFEFMHCHGLGVVGVGTDLPEPVRALLRAGADPAAWQTITGVFSRLGEGCMLTRKNAAAERRADVAEQQVRDRKKNIEDLTGQIAKLTEDAAGQVPRADLDALDARLRAQEGDNVALQSAIEALETRLRDEEGRLSEAQSALIQKRHESDETDAALTALRTEHEALLAELDTLRDASSRHEADAVRLSDDLAERDANIDERFREIAILSCRILDAEAQAKAPAPPAAPVIDKSAADAESKRLRGLIREDKARILRLEAALKATRAELGKARNTQDALLKSTSWKITGPLRRVIRLVRGR